MGIQRRTLPEIRVVTLAQKLSTRIISAGLVPSSMCMPSSNRDATLAFAVCSLASARPMGFRGSSLGLALLYPETSSAASPLDPGWMAILLSREIGGTIECVFVLQKPLAGVLPPDPRTISARHKEAARHLIEGRREDLDGEQKRGDVGRTGQRAHTDSAQRIELQVRAACRSGSGAKPDPVGAFAVEGGHRGHSPSPAPPGDTRQCGHGG